MKKLGFTLAEVLITLVIIGVIAAMTVPTLMNNTNAQEFRSALKKAISSLNQAIEKEYAMEGLNVGDFSTKTKLIDDLFGKNLQVIEKTGDKFITADGMIFTVTQFTPNSCDFENQTACGTIEIDVNGEKGPNMKTDNASHPRDQYVVQLYSQRAVAGDGATQQVMYDKPTKTSNTTGG